MYKAKKNKKFYIAIHTFPKTAKTVSQVYHTGIRVWESQDSYNYSLVLWRIRIIIALNRTKLSEANNE